MRTRLLVAPFALGLVLQQLPARADEPAAASASSSMSLSTSSGASTSSSAAAPSASEPTPAPAAKKDEVSTRTFLSWTAIGVGTLGIALFAVQMVRFGEIRDEQDAAAAKLPASVNACTVQPGAAYFLEARTACDRGETADGVRSLGFVGLVGGLALITTGTVLLLTDKKGSAKSEKKEEPKASWQIAPAIGATNGFVASGSF